MPPNQDNSNLPADTAQAAPAIGSATPAAVPVLEPAASPFGATIPAQATPQAPTVSSGPKAAAETPTKSQNANSTQSSLILSEVRDNMVVMADGSFRAVVACSSINFDLMSNAEREAAEYAYQNFLNSLNFPIQILIRSRRVDIEPYIESLNTLRKQQDNMLLNVLMDDYINFIGILSQEANIMEKSFFVVVPYYPQGDLSNFIDQSKSFLGKLFAKQKIVGKIDSPTYEKAKSEIKNRIDVVISGLAQIGVQSAQLSTKELGELYYNFYNPDTALHQPLGNFENLTGAFIKKATGPEQPQPKGAS